MRHLFASKNHKNNKSLKLQKKLQLEEDRLWRVEQARRQEQELLDAEVARAIQEELEKECPLPPASDSALARRIEHDHERVNTSGRQSTQQPSLVTLNNNQVLSDEEFARRLQEEFDAEREDIQVPSPITPEQGRPVSTIPPALPAKPVAYHNTQHTVGTDSVRCSLRSKTTIMSSPGSSSRPDSSVPDAYREEQRLSSPYTFTAPPYLNAGCGSSPANNTESGTKRSSIPISLNDESSPLSINIPPRHSNAHSPLTVSAPQFTTNSTSCELTTQPITYGSFSTKPTPTPAHENNVHPIIPPAPRLSHAQFHSQPASNPYARSTDDSCRSQGHQQPLYDASNQQSAIGQRSQEEHRRVAPTVGFKLFSGHSTEKDIDAIVPVVPSCHHDENQSTESKPLPKLHKEHSNVSIHMSGTEPPIVSRNDWAPPPPLNPYILPPAISQIALLPKNNTTDLVPLEDAAPKSCGAVPFRPIGILNTGHKPDEASTRELTSRCSHYEDNDSKDDNFSEDFIIRRRDSPVKARETSVEINSLTYSSAQLDPFADSYAVESTQPSEDEDDQESNCDRTAHIISTGTSNPATTSSVKIKCNWAAYPMFNSVNYLDDEDMVNMDTMDDEFSDDNISENDMSEDNSAVRTSSKRRSKSKIAVTVAIQTDPIEEINTPKSPKSNKVPTRGSEHQQCKRSTATRIDPTFGITVLPPTKSRVTKPAKSTNDEPLLHARGTPSTGEMQTHLDEILVDLSTESIIHGKTDKTQLTQESREFITNGPRAGQMRKQRHYSYSMPSLVLPPEAGQSQQQYLNLSVSQSVTTPVTYHDTLYTSTQPLWHHSSQHCSGMMTQSPAPEPFYMGEVPSNEYGYYPAQSTPEKKEPSRPNISNTAAAEKALPNIPKSNPKDRHITIPSIDPSQRVWIRVHPNDTGKDLARRIHIVATYRTRKILSIKTTQGRDVPLDSTPVFDNWSEIEELADGAPWKVEWGPMDDPFSGGRQLFKHIAANLRAAVMD